VKCRDELAMPLPVEPQKAGEPKKCTGAHGIQLIQEIE
jgi:hypothetical protein